MNPTANPTATPEPTAPTAPTAPPAALFVASLPQPHAPELVNRMSGLILGYQASAVVGTMARLRIADQLAGGPLAADEVARRTGCDASATFRLLRAAAAVDLVQIEPTGEFALTPLGACLRSDGPRSLRGLAAGITSRCQYLPSAYLEEAVRSGRSQAPAALGADFFGYLTQHEDELAEFSAAMAGVSEMVTAPFVEAVDLSGAEHVVDVGGGSGTLMAAMLDRNPHLRGTLLERAELLPLARALLSERGLATRCDLVAGDFFESVPEADVHVLKLILHDWDDEHAAAILRNCVRSLRPGGRVVIVDPIVPEDGSQPLLAMLDLSMLTCLGGHERTRREQDALLSEVGLQRVRTAETGSYVQITEAVRA